MPIREFKVHNSCFKIISYIYYKFIMISKSLLNKPQPLAVYLGADFIQLAYSWPAKSAKNTKKYVYHVFLKYFFLNGLEGSKL